jgi:hypothetical protein
MKQQKDEINCIEKFDNPSEQKGIDGKLKMKRQIITRRKVQVGKSKWRLEK